MANEALASFMQVLENVPGWIADLEEILKAASTRQEEILFAHPPPDSPSASSTALPKPKRSLKSRVSKASLKEAVNRANTYLRPQKKQQHTTEFDELRLSQRKRKTDSVCSGNQSGPPKFRNKTATAVYYDGETQKHFEKLVRAIGSSRNAIRKGKMSAKVDALARTGSSSSETSSGGEENDFNPMPPKLAYKQTRPDRLPAFGRSDDVAVFDRLDGQLEKAQSLCERAAHQILRDGDCTLETRNAKEHFEDASRIAEAELPALRKKAERAAEREKRHAEREERLRAEEEAAEQKRRSAAEVAQRIMSSMAASQPTGLISSADALEVDDSSDTDEEEFDISTLRFASKMTHMRSADRLTVR